MNQNLYNLDGIKTQLQRDIDETRAILEAWQAVTFPTKKDGSPFKTLSKNIQGATLEQSPYAMQPGEKRLRVTLWANGIGYLSSEINCYELIRYMKDETMLAKTHNYQPKMSYLEQVYTYDLEDIKIAVQQKIERLSKTLTAYEEQAILVENAYRAFKDAFGAALADLEKNTNKKQDSNLYHLIRDTVLKRYPNC